ncbi:MAG: hypothetical protein IVW55_06735 [Chloroflexi bacterium]|nr:hypothetical protein [Chloroflexota bacterium]
MDSSGGYNSPPQPEMDPNATRYFPPQGEQSHYSDPNRGQTTPLSRADPEPSSREIATIPLLGIALVVGFVIMLGGLAAFSRSGSMAIPSNSHAAPQFNRDKPPWFAQPPSGPESAPFVAPLAPGGLATPGRDDLQDKQDAQASRGSFGAKWRNAGVPGGDQNLGKLLPFALIGLGVFFLVSRSRRQYRRYM